MGFTIQFQGAKDFTPYEGGGDLYPFEGLTFGKIEKIEQSKSKNTGNETFIFNLVCEEAEGGAKGMKAKKWVPVTGNRKDGKPNVLGLLEAIVAIYSMSMSSEEAVAKVRALEGRGIDSDALVQELTGKTVAYDVGMRAYDKDDGSVGYGTEVKNFVLNSRYVDAKAAGAHHRALPERNLAPRTAAPAPAAASGLGTGLGTPNGTTAAPAAKSSAFNIL